MVGSLFLIKLQGFRCFIVNITKSLRAAFFCRIPPVAATADVLFYIIFSKRRCWMYCSHTLQNYFILKPKINLIRFHSMCHSLSFALLLAAIGWHPLSLVVIHCHSLSLVVPLVVTLSFVVPFFVIRCHSLSFAVTRCTTRCHSLSLGVPLVCFFLNNRTLSILFEISLLRYMLLCL